MSNPLPLTFGAGWAPEARPIYFVLEAKAASENDSITPQLHSKIPYLPCWTSGTFSSPEGEGFHPPRLGH